MSGPPSTRPSRNRATPAAWRRAGLKARPIRSSLAARRLASKGCAMSNVPCSTPRASSASTSTASTAASSIRSRGAAKENCTASSGTAATPPACTTSARIAASPFGKATFCRAASPCRAPGCARRRARGSGRTGCGATAPACPLARRRRWACTSGPRTARSAPGKASSRNSRKRSTPCSAATLAQCSSS
ncbi:hypothetical protein D3C86_1681220 [compost metagenome]